MGVFPLILYHWSQFWHQKPRKNEILNFKNYDFCKLLRLAVSPILKIQKFPLGMLIVRTKIFLILHTPFENSTTLTAITGQFVSTRVVKKKHGFVLGNLKHRLLINWFCTLFWQGRVMVLTVYSDNQRWKLDLQLWVFSPYSWRFR